MTNQNHKKKVLIIQGNPDSSSFCDALAAAYKKGAFDANAEVKEIHISEIEFNPNLPFGYKNGSIRNSQQVKRPKSLIVFLFIIFSRACCEAKGEALRYSMHGNENVRNCILKH